MPLTPMELWALQAAGKAAWSALVYCWQRMGSKPVCSMCDYPTAGTCPCCQTCQARFQKAYGMGGKS